MCYRPLVQLAMPCHVLLRRERLYGPADEPVRGVVLHRGPGGPDQCVLGAHHEHQHPLGAGGRPRPRTVEAARGGRGFLSAPEAVRRRRELAATEQRTLWLLAALQSFYVALGSFASAALVSLLGAVVVPMGAGVHVQALQVVGLIAGVLAVSALVHGSVVLVRETRMAVHVLRERAASIHVRAAPHEDHPTWHETRVDGPHSRCVLRAGVCRVWSAVDREHETAGDVTVQDRELMGFGPPWQRCDGHQRHTGPSAIGRIVFDVCPRRQSPKEKNNGHMHRRRVLSLIVMGSGSRKSVKFQGALVQGSCTPVTGCGFRPYRRRRISATRGTVTCCGNRLLIRTEAL